MDNQLPRLGYRGRYVAFNGFESLQMYSQFEDNARKIMQLANQEAQRLNCETIGTGHILIALIRVCSATNNGGLLQIECDLETVRREVRQLIEPANHFVSGKLPLNTEAKQAIEYATKLSGNRSVAPIHLLMGIIQNENAVATRAVGCLGLSPKEVLRDARAAIAT